MCYYITYTHNVLKSTYSLNMPQPCFLRIVIYSFSTYFWSTGCGHILLCMLNVRQWTRHSNQTEDKRILKLCCTLKHDDCNEEHDHWRTLWGSGIWPETWMTRETTWKPGEKAFQTQREGLEASERIECSRNIRLSVSESKGGRERGARGAWETSKSEILEGFGTRGEKFRFYSQHDVMFDLRVANPRVIWDMISQRSPPAAGWRWCRGEWSSVAIFGDHWLGLAWWWSSSEGVSSGHILVVGSVGLASELEMGWLWGCEGKRGIKGDSSCIFGLSSWGGSSPIDSGWRYCFHFLPPLPSTFWQLISLYRATALLDTSVWSGESRPCSLSFWFRALFSLSPFPPRKVCSCWWKWRLD